MRRSFTVATLALLALAACGGDDDPGAPDSAPPPASASGGPATADPAAPPATTTGAAPTTVARTAATSPPSTAAPAMTGNPPVVTLTPIGSFDAPVDVAWRDGDDALYVVEQGGRVQRLDPTGATTTALDVSDLTVADGERGLLGLAFSPAGDLAYVNYTDVTGATTISEHPVAADGTFGTGDDARTVLVIPQPYANHNGGDLAFGPDGLLYIGTGDGGGAGDPERRATNLADLLGKVLRIDPTPSGDLAYTVPPDNPFVGQPGAAPEVWSSGLRNPWRFSFDRATGDLWIADVGQSAEEEISVAPAAEGRDAGKGESFGWSAQEGNAPFNEDVAIEDPVPPLFTYGHDVGCSISGGVRARSGPLPDLVGWYVYGDFCAGRLWALEVLGAGYSMEAGRLVDLGALPAVTAVVDGPAGEVFALSGEGAVVRLDAPA
jgi:glucose/arabinose dehydrogenase